MTQQMNDKEFRFNNVEYREEDDGSLILEGYPIVWDTRTLIGNEEYGFYESIDRHALDGTDMSDVPLRYNHNNVTYILARVRNKSLTLTPDEKGLFMRAKLQGDVQVHRDAYNMVKSGLLDKMSFGFNVTKQTVDNRGTIPSRHVEGIGRLFDVSIVDFPAYDATSVYARSIESVETEIERLENLDVQSVETDDDAEVKLEREKLKNINIMRFNWRS